MCVRARTHTQALFLTQLQPESNPSECCTCSRSPSKRLVRQTVPPPVEEKAKHVPPPARPPRPYDNKVTSLGAREPRRAWGEAAHPSDE